MKKFDMIVIGSGAGMNVGSNALQAGMKVALLEHGPLGGTCLNNGCIPTKILTTPADIIRAMGDAKDLGIKGHVHSIDFDLIMKRTHSFVDEGRTEMEMGVKSDRNLTLYTDTGHFIGDYKMKVGREKITAPRIVIASGSRPLVPDIPGLKKHGYIDNVSVLNIKRPPKSLLILGGGYIAVEFGHFFSAMKTRVTIVGRNPYLLKNEEPEISEIVKKKFSRYVKIRTGHEVLKVTRENGQKVVHARNQENGKIYKFKGEEIMLAVGRRSNADLLKPNATGVKTDRSGWIIVNQYLETAKPGIYALGDALGKYMFRHTANYESDIVSANLLGGQERAVDYHAVPHAVFGYPQVGGVGLTEAQAKDAGYDLLVGRSKYTDVAKGYAMGEEDSLVKVIVEMKTRKILGAHIVGSEAADLVQQLVYLMNAGQQDYIPIARAQVIHPALSEAVVRAFGNLAPPEGHGHHDHHH